MRKMIAVTFAVGVLAAVGGIAYATIPDENGIIHGCRHNSSGNLRVIDSASQSCLSAETELNWSQQGGVSNLTVRGTSGNPDATVSSATHFCLAGEVATGGGVRADLSDGAFPVVGYSFPQYTATGTPTGWSGEVRNLGSGTVTAVVNVICASE